MKRELHLSLNMSTKSEEISNFKNANSFILVFLFNIIDKIMIGKLHAYTLSMKYARIMLV